MLDFFLLGFAIILWAYYCCKRRNGIPGLRRVPILPLEPKEKMTEADRLKLIEKQLVTVTIGGSVQSIRNLITSAQSLYEANRCNCSGSAEHEKDFNESGSERSCLSRTWSAASTTIAQHRQEECTICFEEYKEADKVCWAKTDQCSHVFHKKCVVEWLKQHDECPLCRIDIVHAKTVAYELVDSEREVTDLELGHGEGGEDDAGTSNDNHNGDEETMEVSMDTSELPGPTDLTVSEVNLQTNEEDGHKEEVMARCEDESFPSDSLAAEKAVGQL